VSQDATLLSSSLSSSSSLVVQRDLQLDAPDKTLSDAPSYPTNPNRKDLAAYVQLESKASYPKAPSIHLKPGIP